MTVASMNTEVRDHANFLKGALDLITASTTADTGTATYLSVTRAAATDTVVQGLVTADTVARVVVDASGEIELGPGNAARDVRLARGLPGKFTVDSNAAAVDTVLELKSVAGQRSYYTAFVTGDTNYRAGLFGDALLSGLELGPGNAARDVRLSRQSSGVAQVDTNGLAFATVLRVQSTAGQRTALDLLVSGDSTQRARLAGDATLTGIEFGSGAGAADTRVYRGAAGDLRLDTGGSALATRVLQRSTVTHTNRFEMAVEGDSQVRASLRGDATNTSLWLGAGGAVAPLQVVGQRQTGYAAMTGTLNRATAYATGTVTLVQLAERVAALQADLTAHGLIGA